MLCFVLHSTLLPSLRKTRRVMATQQHSIAGTHRCQLLSA